MCIAVLKKALNKLALREYKAVAKTTILEIEKKEDLIMTEREKLNPTDETKETEKVETEKEPEVKEEMVETKEKETQETPATETKETETDETKETEKQESADQAQVVDTESTEPNAISIADIVTKAELQEMLGALNAKLDALIKENGDLKDANAKLTEKYESGDFGTDVRQGTIAGADKATKSYQSFDDYAKQFM